MYNLQNNKVLLILLALIISATSYAQRIVQTNMLVSFACPNNNGGGFNDFGVYVEYGAPGFGSSNEFSVEISDENGNFDDSNPIFITTGISGENKTIPNGGANEAFTTNVQLPTDVYGENYKIRVHASETGEIGPASVAFSAFFTARPTDVNLQIEGPTSYTICGGNSVTLKLNNDSFPLYQWYKDFVPYNPNGGQDPTGNTITITEAGNYYAAVYYGPCTDSAGVNSRLVSVTMSADDVTASIMESDASICIGDVYSLSASPSDSTYEYVWFKDGTEVARGTGLDNYTVSTATPFGAYTVSITNTSGCEDTSSAVNVSNAGTEITVSTSTSENQILLPTKSTTLSVSSSDSSSTVEWFFNGGSTSIGNSFDLVVNTPGSYQATVTGSGACGDVKQSPVFNIYAPEAYEVTIAADANYEDCGNPPTTLGITKLEATAKGGVINTTIDSGDYSLFTYEWFRDTSSISGATDKEITINDRTENGNYELEVSDGSLTSMSNSLTISLGLEAISISSTQSKLCPGSSDTITLSSEEALNAAYTYQWFKDGNPIAGATGATTDISEIGSYQFIASAFGCSSSSNEIVITNFDVDTVVISPSEFVTIAEGSTQEVVASGADSYSWTNDTTGAITTGDRIVVSEEGTYTLTASVGTCTVTKTITVEFNLSGLIPNVVSPNGDNKNDTWILPGGFNSEKVEVVIYDSSGRNVLKTTRYSNDWPRSASMQAVKDGSLFYYAISKDNVLFKKGTITVLQ
ncbi:gliding motility-associated C-terminal domain-containing protein [Spongiivirga sp. MCCC 1A20706]|uniref:T9SS type B sorting domain-containing protein n=1 Tax=Spongiivirga sp. MCCC 1A20706 TaxID=3160963 RepID=UPI0039779FCB